MTLAAAPVALPDTIQLLSAIPVAAASRTRMQGMLPRLLPSIVALWAAGVLLLSLRWIGAWTCLYRLRRAPSLPVPEALETLLRDLMRRAAVGLPVRSGCQFTPRRFRA